jgi:hypothetical protein
MSVARCLDDENGRFLVALAAGQGGTDAELPEFRRDEHNR